MAIVEKKSREEWREMNNEEKRDEFERQAQAYLDLYKDGKQGRILSLAYSSQVKANLLKLHISGVDQYERKQRHYDKGDFKLFVDDFLPLIDSVISNEGSIRDVCVKHGYEFRPWRWLNGLWVTYNAWSETYAHRADLVD